MKETSEAIVGLVALAKEVAVLAKDGLDVSDAVALAKKVATDEVFRDKITSAVQNCGAIPAELTPVTVEKVIALVLALTAALK